MIVDLARSGFNHLEVHISLETSQDVVRAAWESVELGQMRRVGDHLYASALSGFQRGGRKYRVNARLSTGASTSSLTLNYFLAHSRDSAYRRATLNGLGLLLDNLSVPCAVTCSSAGHFRLDRFKPLLELPLIRFGAACSFFDEIRGIRLAKVQDGTESDSVALDLYTENEIHVYTRASYTTTSSSDISPRALVRLTRLKNHALTEVEEVAEEKE